jgi:anti-sigma factor RsiW
MNLDDSTLIAYVDGELDSADAASIEAELADSPDLQTSVDRLRASRLGYQSAFATQKLPPMPAGLLRSIEAMASEAQRKQGGNASQAQPPAANVRAFPPAQAGSASASTASTASTPSQAAAVSAGAASAQNTHPASSAASVSASASQADNLQEVQRPASAEHATLTQIKPAPAANGRLWLVAAFVAGAFCAGLALQFGSELLHSSGSTVSVASGEPTPWVRAAADYQRLYTRDTVADVSVDMNASAKTVEAIRQTDHVALRVPDLRQAGIAFKSVARLQFNDKPLVQIVYLPEHGAPIALCVMKDSRPDQAIAQAQVSGMNVVSWRQNELSYALIGKPDSGDLGSLAQQILTSRVDAMFADSGVLRALTLASRD